MRRSLMVGIRRFDALAERALDQLRGRPLVDRALYAASEAGNFSALWHAVAWLPALARRDPKLLRAAAATSLALGLESALVNGPIKACFRRARPAPGDTARPHRLRTPKTSSFPSGHASAAVVATASLSTMFPRWRPPLTLAAAAVATSRVHVRIHHASDVVGGIAIGVLLARPARALVRAALRP